MRDESTAAFIAASDQVQAGAERFITGCLDELDGHVPDFPLFALYLRHELADQGLSGKELLLVPMVATAIRMLVQQRSAQ